MKSPRSFLLAFSRSWRASFLGLVAGALTGCVSAPPPASPPPLAHLSSARATPVPPPGLDPGLLSFPTDVFTLGPGDKLDIEFIGDVASRTSVEVGPDGKIYFYLLPGMDVWGLTLPEAQARIATQAEVFLKKAPSVAITLREVGSQRVWLLGQVNHPGVFPLAGPMTLLEAISVAGGPTPALEINGPGSPKTATSDLPRAFVLRRGQLLAVDFARLVLTGDLTQNIYLQPGDVVYVPSATARTVHVMGAVSLPGAVTSGDDLSLIQTIASAGGTLKDAYLTHVAIVRGSLTEPTISIVDYHAMLKGAAQDVRLEPHDIVYVPYSPYRTVTRYLDLILQTFARTVGVNEGARAIDNGSPAVGINVPLGTLNP